MANESVNSKNTFEALNNYAVEIWLVSDLKTDEKHPRKVTKKQVEKAAAFIRAASWTPPVVINRRGIILAGQEWYEAAKILGMESIQVVAVDSLSEAQMRLFRIAYVRIQEDGEWDAENLKAEFQFLIETEISCNLDFRVEITGFETAEIDLLLSEQTKETEPDPADTTPEPQKIVVTKPGDVWKLGNHFIICGDARDPAVYKQLLNGVSVQLVCSDPPFNVQIGGFVSSNDEHEEFVMGSGEFTSPEFENFLFESISGATAGLEDGACCYLFMDWRHDRELQAAARRCGLTQLNLCIWDKGVGGMGSFYRSQHELIFVYRKGKKSHRNNIQLGKFGRNRTNVWAYPSANMSKEGRKALKDHPTPKPVAMIADIIMDVTSPNDLVLDPFLGGGTSVIAAEKTNRRCRGIELDPRYVDVSIRRWQDMTGQTAIHAETGLTFAEQGDDHG